MVGLGYSHAQIHTLTPSRIQRAQPCGRIIGVIHAGIYILLSTTVTSIPPRKDVLFNPCLSVHKPQNQGAMTASKIAAADASDANRQRRAHKKSRRGCSSCKLRRVKCDERRPVCRKCRDYGVACTYDGKISALSFAGESSFSLNEPSASSEEAPISAKVNTRDQSLDVARIEKLPRSRCLSESSTVLTQFSGLPSPPDSDGENSNYAFGRSELEIFQRFNARTVLSVGSSQTAQIYQREIFQLACSVSGIRPSTNRIALTVLTVSFPGTHCDSSDITSRSSFGWNGCYKPQDSVTLVSRHCKVQRGSHAANQRRKSRCSMGKCSSDVYYPICNFRG
jgi:hypothetical protein